ncbi:LytR/AlgR family response regulator transcription factor [Formosa sediminum]|uniref:LytR/AlgR family response regulator transcription factor n=1 Tax=Formosa sediminum TaxID=2594004 RepID=UPI001FE9FBBD|nr:LytTR family DNA-binding domain-containing protein [Formosa sediminum]
MNLVIIEDEPAIVRNLEFSINEIDSSIKIVKTLSSIKEAVKWLSTDVNQYDLLFMDIRLSDGLSFEIFETITILTPVIFITAYNDYALEAFKFNGIDYILKPFDNIQIKKALDKYENLSHSTRELSSSKMVELMNYFKKYGFHQEYKKSYLVHYQNKLIPLDIDKIHWFYTSQEITYAYTENGTKYTIDASLEKIQAEINPNQFYRANRQYIVQRKAIKDIDFYFNGRLVLNVLPKPQDKIIVSKAKATECKKWMDI